jgi:magnesium transporter
VVQSLARGDDPFDSILQKVGKEALVGLINGILCSLIIFLGSLALGTLNLGIVVSLSLLTVIVFAAVFGTMIPLILHRYKIDPALATGPFVTTSNDLVGLFIYFSIGILLLN